MTTASRARHILDCLARNDLSVFDAHCHPDAQFFHCGMDEPLDRHQMREVVEAFHAAFTDYTLTVHEVVTEGDAVAVYVTSSATQEAAYRDMPATDARLEYDEVMFLFFEEGRVIRMRKLFDSLLLREQLGMTLVPATDTAAAR